ncbi:biotin/lipoyl-binding protein [Lacihabitans sp. CCS-44]|uniref:biotin/lipoyl-containing protein n=1 Tax=Lacihabitans sp. CCS-44 TaxID=2487331 RepID=UPI0020CDC10D|nr:biotin/lipoyl-containing protein [Lacihabitans sp. CCS-44]MCP9757576.1 biotin/lipoyl-binding protein [Lacihabitans sp. CCS-44]
MTDKNIIVNAGGFEFLFTESEIAAIDVLNNKAEDFCILSEQKTLTGEILSVKVKVYNVEIDGERFQVQIKNELDQILDNMGLNKPKVSKIKSIKAPMPGLVIEINVEEGQTVAENDKILILEAMKMENVIKIPHEAVVKKINIVKGQAVDKGQVLIELE